MGEESVEAGSRIMRGLFNLEQVTICRHDVTTMDNITDDYLEAH